MNTPGVRNPDRLFTLRSGGWVALLATALVLAVMIWAMAPALWRAATRPPGDGRNVETYGFDLSTIHIARETFVPVMLHRDMVPVLTDPPILSMDDAVRLTQEERGKFLVSTDRVIGVEIGGEARAYPISLLTVHEVVNDTLGGIPIAVTYSWLGDAVRVFDRRAEDEVVELGVSGLVSNANTLLYDRREPAGVESFVPWEQRGESLWRQIDGVAVTGPAAEDNRALETIPAQLVSWRQWRERHPDSTVLARNPGLLKRYRRASPDQYFIAAEIPYPVDPLPEDQRLWKKRIVAIRTAERWIVYPYRAIARHAATGEEPSDLGRLVIELDEGPVILTFDARAETVAVNGDAVRDLVHCFWFIWHAANPGATIEMPFTE